MLVGEKVDLGVVPPPSLFFTSIEGYSCKKLAEDMFRKGTVKRSDSKGTFPNDLHYYNEFKGNQSLYQKILRMTDEDFESSNENTAYGR